MTPTQARAFLAVAIEGSFSAGARRLNVSQPTVTSQVAAIERQYKVELFHRMGRGVRLTGAGSELLPIVRRMFATFDEASAYLEDFRGLRRGYLRVGSCVVSEFLVLVARHKVHFPSTLISIELGNSGMLAEKLLSCELDIALLDRMNVHSAFQNIPFRKCALVAIAPKGSEWSRHKSISIERLKQHVVICREPGSKSRIAFDQLMSTTGTPANHQLVQISSQEGVIAAVLAGVGLGIIFDQGAALDPRLTVLSIRGPEMISYLDLVCLHERGTSHAISGFLTISREYLQEHEPGSVVAARGGSCKTTRRSCAR